MFQSRRYGWSVIGLGVGVGVLLAAGAARATDDPGAPSPPDGQPPASEPQSVERGLRSVADADHCKDAGVTVTFDTGSAGINGRGQSSLKGVAKWQQAGEGRSLRVDGYTDKTGNAAVNQRLSDQRAEAVKTYLVSLGVPPPQVDTTGHGEHAGDRPDLRNTRAVAVTTCQAETHAAATPTPPPPLPEVAETPPPVPPPVVFPPPVVVHPIAQPTNVEVNVVAPPPAKNLPPSGIGIGFTLGGGATGFVDQGARAFVETGGAWEARLVLGTRLPIAFEGAYIGSAQGIQALGLQTNALLIGNGAEGTARINFSTSRIQPYIFGGAGWTNYQIRNTQIATADLQRSDNVLTIPFGVGLSARFAKSFLLDVRGTGRLAFDDDLLNQLASTNNAGNGGLNSWNASAHLGWEF